MRFRRHHSQRFVIGLRHPKPDSPAQLMWIKIAELFHGAAVDSRHEQSFLGRRINDTQGGHAIFDQSDVHGEIAAAPDEFLRSIERIDDQKGRRVQTMRRGLLFGDEWKIRKSFCQTCRDQPVCSLVRLGDRAFVRLGSDVKVVTHVHMHDDFPCLDRQAAHCR